jgi:hypothetical protein
MDTKGQRQDEHIQYCANIVQVSRQDTGITRGKAQLFHVRMRVCIQPKHIRTCILTTSQRPHAHEQKHKYIILVRAHTHLPQAFGGLCQAVSKKNGHKHETDGVGQSQHASHYLL